MENEGSKQIKLNFTKGFEVNLELFVLGLLSFLDASLGTALGVSFFKSSCAFSYVAAVCSPTCFNNPIAS